MILGTQQTFSLTEALARLVFGSHYVAVVRFDYDDPYGKDSLTTTLKAFRARSKASAASAAIQLAQKEAQFGWISVFVQDVQCVDK